MRFIIINTISYNVNEQLVNDFLKKENITIEDYKNKIINGFKEMIESGIGTSEDINNLAVETNVEVN